MYQVPSMPGTPHLDHKSFHGSMMIRGGNPAKMVLTENGAPSHLPMRDTKRSTLPHKDYHHHGLHKGEIVYDTLVFLIIV